MRWAALLAVFVAIAGCGQRQQPKVCVPVLPGWTTPQIGPRPYLLANNIRIRGREIRWNGVVVDEATLAKYLRLSSELNPRPFVIFDPETRNCAAARRMRDVIDRNYPCRDGACGQGSIEAFRTAPYRMSKGPPA